MVTITLYVTHTCRRVMVWLSFKSSLTCRLKKTQYEANGNVRPEAWRGC